MTASQAAQMLRESGITQESNPLLYNSLVALASTAAGALVGGEMGAGTALNEVANNFLKHDRPQYYAARLKECTSQSCKDQVLDEIMKESNQNVGELGACWESGDSDCVKRIGSEIETNPMAYTGILSGTLSDAGRYVYDSANRFADLIEKGNEHNWVVANLLHETSGLVEYADFLLLGGFGKGKPGADLAKQEVKPGAGVGVVEKEVVGEGVVNKKIPGVDKPFRGVNPEYPPNSAVVEKMNNLKICSGTDCSEIANILKNTAGEGRILTVTGRGGSDLKLPEYGKVDSGFKYHEIFTDGRYVYDPRLSSTPVPLSDWKRMIQGLNPGALIK
jgi:hypothetical protein